MALSESGWISDNVGRRRVGSVHGLPQSQPLHLPSDPGRERIGTLTHSHFYRPDPEYIAALLIFRSPTTRLSFCSTLQALTQILLIAQRLAGAFEYVEDQGLFVAREIREVSWRG